MQIKKELWIFVALIVVVAAVSIGLVATSSNGPSKSTSSTIAYAELPGAHPNYIFPFMGGQFFSVDNINHFQELMYRPLYWFGLGSSVSVVPSLSLADMPSFSNANKTVTITTKGWKFADGQIVNAQADMFFLNLYKADPTSFAGYNLGFGIPDQVKSASGSGDTVTINFVSSVNPNWVLYNYLSEITPFSDSWAASRPRSRRPAPAEPTAPVRPTRRARRSRSISTFSRPRPTPSPTPCGRAAWMARGS